MELQLRINFLRWRLTCGQTYKAYGKLNYIHQIRRIIETANMAITVKQLGYTIDNEIIFVITFTIGVRES